MKISLSILLLYIVFTCLPASAAEKSGDPQSIGELQAGLERILRETNTQGMAIAIVSAERTEWIAGLGLADVAANKAVTSKTLFRIGSISKGFAALAALKLQEEGRLKLTDTLRQWAPEIPFQNPWEDTDPVRLVHLMEHTSGIPNMRLSEAANSDPRQISLQEAFAFAPQFRVTRWRPGTRMAYTNAGPAMLARVIEKATGQSFEDYVRNTFFAPLGMNSANYFLSPEVEKSLAKLYMKDGRQTYPYWHLMYRPAGSINASAEDMANYVRFFLQRGSCGGRQLLQATSIDRMESPRTLPIAQLGEIAGYGLYCNTGYENGFEFHGHDGGLAGARAEMEYCPEIGRGFAFMINSDSDTAKWRMAQLIRRYLVQGLASPPLPPAVSLSPELQMRCSGYYANISLRNEGVLGMGEYFVSLKRVEFAAGVMSLRPVLTGWPESWVPISDTLFRREQASKPGLVFLTDKEGRSLLQSDQATMEKISPFCLWGLVGGLILSMLLLYSAPAFAVIWGVRWIFGKLRAPGPLSVRALPLLGSLLVLGLFAALAGAAMMDPSIMGTVNALTVSILLISLSIPLVTLLSLYAAWSHRTVPMNRFAYWHSLGVALGLSFMTGLSFYWGLIGLRLWV